MGIFTQPDLFKYYKKNKCYAIVEESIAGS